MLKGDVLLFTGFDLKKDEIFHKLVKPSDEFDILTLQALELIFAALVIKMKRMLEDHLPGGKYANQTPAEFCGETKSVEKTNVLPERDFGMFDRLMVEKPCATTLVLEGIVMFNKNQTADKKTEVMTLARLSKAKQKHAEKQIGYLG